MINYGNMNTSRQANYRKKNNFNTNKQNNGYRLKSKSKINEELEEFKAQNRGEYIAPIEHLFFAKSVVVEILNNRKKFKVGDYLAEVMYTFYKILDGIMSNESKFYEYYEKMNEIIKIKYYKDIYYSDLVEYIVFICRMLLLDIKDIDYVNSRTNSRQINQYLDDRYLHNKDLFNTRYFLLRALELEEKEIKSEIQYNNYNQNNEELSIYTSATLKNFLGFIDAISYGVYVDQLSFVDFKLIKDILESLYISSATGLRKLQILENYNIEIYRRLKNICIDAPKTVHIRTFLTVLKNLLQLNENDLVRLAGNNIKIQTQKVQELIKQNKYLLSLKYGHDKDSPSVYPFDFKSSSYELYDFYDEVLPSFSSDKLEDIGFFANQRCSQIFAEVTMLFANMQNVIKMPIIQKTPLYRKLQGKIMENDSRKLDYLYAFFLSMKWMMKEYNLTDLNYIVTDCENGCEEYIREFGVLEEDNFAKLNLDNDMYNDVDENMYDDIEYNTYEYEDEIVNGRNIYKDKYLTQFLTLVADIYNDGSINFSVAAKIKNILEMILNDQKKYDRFCFIMEKSFLYRDLIKQNEKNNYLNVFDVKFQIFTLYALLNLNDGEMKEYKKNLMQLRNTQDQIQQQAEYERCMVYLKFRELKFFIENDPDDALDQYEADIKYNVYNGEVWPEGLHDKILDDYYNDKELLMYLQDIDQMSRNIINVSKIPLINKVSFYRYLVNKSSEDGFNNINYVRKIVKYLSGLLKLDLLELINYNVDKESAIQNFYEDIKRGEAYKQVSFIKLEPENLGYYYAALTQSCISPFIDVYGNGVTQIEQMLNMNNNFNNNNNRNVSYNNNNNYNNNNYNNNNYNNNNYNNNNYNNNNYNNNNYNNSNYNNSNYNNNNYNNNNYNNSNYNNNNYNNNNYNNNNYNNSNYNNNNYNNNNNMNYINN